MKREVIEPCMYCSSDTLATIENVENMWDALCMDCMRDDHVLSQEFDGLRSLSVWKFVNVVSSHLSISQYGTLGERPAPRNKTNNNNTRTSQHNVIMI